MNSKRRFGCWGIFLGILCFFCAPSAFSQETMTLPCEVMESSHAIKSSMAKLNGVRFLLLHQANSADRETLSNWLTRHSGAEVMFSFKGEQHKAVLFRLAHCFGRGLLIYSADVQPPKREIIHVVFPLAP